MNFNHNNLFFVWFLTKTDSCSEDNLDFRIDSQDFDSLLRSASEYSVKLSVWGCSILNSFFQRYYDFLCVCLCATLTPNTWFFCFFIIFLVILFYLFLYIFLSYIYFAFHTHTYKPNTPHTLLIGARIRFHYFSISRYQISLRKLVLG